MEALCSSDRDLFEALRCRAGARIAVSFAVGISPEGEVGVPAVRFRLQGRLRPHPRAERFEVELEGKAPEDLARFGRRRGRGRADYWQGALEIRSGGRPGLVLYFTMAELQLELLPP